MKSKEMVKETADVSFKLASYDDVFSDFDSRNYFKKALSDDFLAELKRASLDKSRVSELKIFMPSNKRTNDEIAIRKRLKEHFSKHFNLLNIEHEKLVKWGVSFVAAGIILMFVATFILFYYGEKTLLLNFLVILLEPGGWFLFWEGLDTIIFRTKGIKSDLEFYRKMSGCRIVFLPH